MEVDILITEFSKTSNAEMALQINLYTRKTARSFQMNFEIGFSINHVKGYFRQQLQVT
uniref:Uncharacterized protein n=1 Tax=Anguilla anguilla TaxID=7936 RepID=A0A0E9X0X7_ANGAN